MMRVIFILMLFVSIGCDNRSGGGSSKPSPGKPAPIKPLPKWGELSCQKERTCQNGVLHLNDQLLIAYFDIEFSERLDIPVLQCVQKAMAAWEEYFGRELLDDAIQSSLVDEFLSQFIDVNACTAHRNYSIRLTDYFQSTKDYKNETSN